tara:strand:+ start:208 stop:462 length:255 start_codon:yes stop_codon:yes gene_type:complete
MKIKEEELKKIKDQQEAVASIVSNIGLLETQKHGLLHELATLNEQVNKFKEELKEEYGEVNINLSDGSYTLIPEESDEQVTADV